MTRRTTVGIVIIMLHLLQRCSATNVTTTVMMNEETSTSGSVTASTTLQSNSTNSTTLSVSECSESYVQNGDPQVSTGATSSMISTAADSEQVANTSPTQEASTSPPLFTNENVTTPTPSVTIVSESVPVTPFPVQNSTSPYNKSSDELVSSSKVNMANDSETIVQGEVDTDAIDTIAEKEVSNTNGTETEPKFTNEKDQIEKKDDTVRSEDLARAGVKIGEADVFDDDAEDPEELSETVHVDTTKSDYDVEKNDTSNLNSTLNQNPNEMDGFEVQLLAADMDEVVQEADSSPSSANADTVIQSTTEGLPVSPNTESTTKTNDNSSSSNTDNVANTQSPYETSLNETEQETKATQSVSQEPSKDLVQAPPREDNGTMITQDNANPFQFFKLPSFAAPNADVGNENKQYVEQQATSNDTFELNQDNSTPATTVTSAVHNASSVDSTPTYGSVPKFPQSFGGFEQVQLLAADISMDELKDQGMDENQTAPNNQNIQSDLNPIEVSNTDKDSSTDPKLSDSNGIISECDSSLCNGTYHQTPLNNTDDGQNDQDDMSNIQATSGDPLSSNGSQSYQTNENNSPSVDSTVGNTAVEPQANDTIQQSNAPINVSDDVPASISSSEPQTSEDGVAADEMHILQNSTAQESNSTLAYQEPMVQDKETTTNGQHLNNSYQIPPGNVLTILIENGEIASVSTDPQPIQETGAFEAKESDKQVKEMPKEDDVFGENGQTASVSRDSQPIQKSEPFEPKESNGKQLKETPNQDDNLSDGDEIIELLADDITYTTTQPTGCPFSAKASTDAEIPNGEQQRKADQRPEDQIVEDAYYYGLDPFCLTRHHILIPALPVMLPQWCFVPDTPDFMCPRYDLGFHIAFAHETHRDMYYRCVYGQAVLLKCPNLHYWDDERKICTLMTDFSHYQRHRTHRSQNLYDQATHHHCQQCRRNFLRPQDLDPTAQCSDRMLLACNTDGTLSVYECPGFYFYDRHVQLRWYADLERCDYPADGDGPWSR